MEPSSGGLALLMITVIAPFIVWLIKSKFNQVEDIDDRLIKVETKLDVLGDIKDSLHHVRTDVEVIKSRLEERD